VAALNSNYEATREDFEVLFSQQDAHREALLRETLNKSPAAWS
jgi:hypothetical protein